MSKIKTIETQRLSLKPIDIEDEAFLRQLVNTPKWLEYIGDRNIKTKKECINYIRTKMRPQIEQLGYGNYVVVRKSDDKKLGTCGLFDRAELEGVDIGFAFLPEFENMGYAFESSQKLLTKGFDKFNIKTISAITLPSNKSSQKLLEKLGLEFVKMVKLNSDEAELMLYCLDSSDC